MKPNHSRLYYLLVLLPLLFTFLLVSQLSSAAAVPGADVATVTWSDGFESYTACGEGSTDCLSLTAAQRTQLYFPRPEWTHSGLQDAFVYTDVPYAGVKVLKMHGLSDQYGGSVAYRPLGGSTATTVYPPYEIDFYARSGGPEDPNYPIVGGHLKTVGLELSSSASVSGADRGLLAFSVKDIEPGGTNLEIRGGVFDVDPELGDGIYLQDWVANRWYHITVRYEPVDDTTIRLTYFIDDIKRGEHTLPIKPSENVLDYLGLWAGNGQVWYDNVTVKASTEPFFFDTPDPTPVGGDVFLPIVVRH